MTAHVERQPGFEAVYEQQFPELYGFTANLFARRSPDSEGLAQEAMLRLWRTGPEIEEINPRAWLATVAGRIAIDDYRKRQCRPDEFLTDEQEFFAGTAPDDIEQINRRMLVEQALEFMNPEQQAVVRRTFFEGKLVEEVARELDIPTGTVKSRQYYGLRAAREGLAGIGIEADILG